MGLFANDLRFKGIEAMIDNDEWSSLSYDEKNRRMLQRQKKTLAIFLEKGAISREQHDKGLRVLTQNIEAVPEG